MSFTQTEGPIELSKQQLDMMKRYAHSFDEDGFLLELDFARDSAHFAASSSFASAPHRALPAKVGESDTTLSLSHTHIHNTHI